MWPDKLESGQIKNMARNGLLRANIETRTLDVSGADFWYNAKKFLATKKTDEDEKASSRHWFANQCR